MLYFITFTSLILTIGKSLVDQCPDTTTCPDTDSQICCMIADGAYTTYKVETYKNECFYRCTTKSVSTNSMCGACCDDTTSCPTSTDVCKKGSTAQGFCHSATSSCDNVCNNDSECPDTKLSGMMSIGTCAVGSNGCDVCTYTTRCDSANNYCVSDNECITSPNTECVGATADDALTIYECGKCLDPCRDQCIDNTGCMNGATCSGKDIKGCNVCVFATTACVDECIDDSECPDSISGGYKRTGTCGDSSSGCKVCSYTTSCDTGYCSDNSECITAPNTECVGGGIQLDAISCGTCQDPCRDGCNGDSECPDTKLSDGTMSMGTCAVGSNGCNVCTYRTRCDSANNYCVSDNECITSPNTECVGATTSDDGLTIYECGKCLDPCWDQCIDNTGCMNGAITGTCSGKDIKGCNVCVFATTGCVDECIDDSECADSISGGYKRIGTCGDSNSGCKVCSYTTSCDTGYCSDNSECITAPNTECVGGGIQLDAISCGTCQDPCRDGCNDNYDCAKGEICDKSRLVDSTAATATSDLLIGNCGQCVSDKTGLAATTGAAAATTEGYCENDTDCSTGNVCKFMNYDRCTPQEFASATGVVTTEICTGKCVANNGYCDAIDWNNKRSSFYMTTALGVSSDFVGGLCQYCLCTESGQRKCDYVVTFETIAKKFDVTVDQLVARFNTICYKDRYPSLANGMGDQCDYLDIRVKDAKDIEYCGCPALYCIGGTYQLNGSNQLRIMVGIVFAFIMTIFSWM